ncbi:DUF983 domain-containing protein [Alkalicaulis satelles]|uniref:DUF983 domain-containing protein n=1 Tax=Alkalicaulis satelles TaxID=2609175 RepID=A0A5M6ZEU0_9PROT|nr:DUF983 domain-containing protein [Alkalicaulis satelles]KAA5801618.1 DUF983 domain-containing protein [Alkalicaulis satelles]
MLRFADRCGHCGQDFSREDAGDGPAVFVIFAVGFILVPMALVAEVAFTPPFWVHALLWLPLAAVLCLALLRVFRGAMFALQYRQDASEGRLDDRGDGP